jgi:hypothetical protein
MSLIYSYWNHDALIELIIFYVIIGLTHILLHLYDKNTPEKYQWYIVHFIGNMIVCYNSIHDIIYFNKNPIEELTTPVMTLHTTLPALYIHIHHATFYKLDRPDKIHNLIYGVGEFLCFTHINIGRIFALYHFFVIGLPCGICYLLAYLNCKNRVSRQNQLKIDAFINRWIRDVVLDICGALVIAQFIYSDKQQNDVILLLFGIIATFYNSIYYTKISIKKCIEYELLNP